MKFTKAEKAALNILTDTGGILISRIPDKNEIDPVFRNIEPGMKVYKRLEALGLVIITEEEPVEDLDGFCFTPSVELTEAGIEAANVH